ncbi:MAG: hypothetical protein Q9213_005079 [Squamulea squamosa]
MMQGPGKLVLPSSKEVPCDQILKFWNEKERQRTQWRAELSDSRKEPEVPESPINVLTGSEQPTWEERSDGGDRRRMGALQSERKKEKIPMEQHFKLQQPCAVDRFSHLTQVDMVGGTSLAPRPKKSKQSTSKKGKRACANTASEDEDTAKAATSEPTEVDRKKRLGQKGNTIQSNASGVYIVDPEFTTNLAELAGYLGFTDTLEIYQLIRHPPVNNALLWWIKSRLNAFCIPGVKQILCGKSISANVAKNPLNPTQWLKPKDKGLDPGTLIYDSKTIEIMTQAKRFYQATGGLESYESSDKRIVEVPPPLRTWEDELAQAQQFSDTLFKAHKTGTNSHDLMALDNVHGEVAP